MKAEITITALLMTSVTGACAAVADNVPIETRMPVPSLTISSPSPTPTATWWVTPVITATPLDVVFDSNMTVEKVIRQMHPGICTGSNLAIAPPPPKDLPFPFPLKFVQVEGAPDRTSYYFHEIADNIDGSRQAFIACNPEECQDKVYVRDTTTEEVLEIEFGAVPGRPILWLAWINRDTLVFTQSSNPHYGLVVVIDFDKRQYQYYGMASDECSGRTPSP
jgi:hypothetical protein